MIEKMGRGLDTTLLKDPPSCAISMGATKIARSWQRGDQMKAFPFQ